jgi:ribonuclease P/MRP protein subunit POP3
MAVDNPDASAQENHTVEPTHDGSAVAAVPPILKLIKFGINEVAKLLESQISRLRQCLLDKRPMEDDDTPSPLVVLACRWDINPPTLLAHIPHLVASVNTLATTYRANFTDAPPVPEVKLVNLPKGSENPLAEALGMRRVSVIALNVCGSPLHPAKTLSDSFQSGAVLDIKLGGLLKVVPRLATPWLIPTTNRTTLVPRLELTRVKHLKTTAPIDIRAAKQERIEARKAAKQRRKRRSQATRSRREPSDTQMATDP